MKSCVTEILLYCILIKNCIFSLLHTEIDVANKIVTLCIDWIDKIIELITNEEILSINNKLLLMNDNIRLIKVRDYWIKNDFYRLGNTRLLKNQLNVFEMKD